MKNYNNGTVRISVISNIVCENLESSLRECFEGYEVLITSIQYWDYMNHKYMENYACSDLIIVWLNFEFLFPDAYNQDHRKQVESDAFINDVTKLCASITENLTNVSNCKVYWLLFEDYFLPIRQIIGYVYNFSIVDILNQNFVNVHNQHVFCVNTKDIIAEIGIQNAFDKKSKYRWSSPYSRELISTVGREIYKQYKIENSMTKKCLVLDCDNVLWGGILADDGIENIKLGSTGYGRIFQDFQRFLLYLYNHGVTLSIVSKNNSKDVLDVFTGHSDMILHENHIACFQINWDNKPDNIRIISKSLNIGLDQMVFVDDMQFEIEAVRSMIPEVTTILFEHNSIYDILSCFNLKIDTNLADIERRNMTYRTNNFRETLKAQYSDYVEFINALEMKIDIHEAKPIEYNRISELTQRTNKCTNGRRYTVAEILQRITRNDVTLYALTLSDRYSDLGLVGSFEVEDNTLTVFSLSCRALGREIENRMLEYIALKHKINYISFSYTQKNNEIRTLFVQIFPDATFL